MYGGAAWFDSFTCHHGSVAQLVERRTEDPSVRGSIPCGATILLYFVGAIMTREELIEAIAESVTYSKKELRDRMAARASKRGLSADYHNEKITFGPHIADIGNDYGQDMKTAMYYGGANPKLTTTQRVLSNIHASRMRSHHAENSRVMAKGPHSAKATHLARMAQRSPQAHRHLKDQIATMTFPLTSTKGKYTDSPFSKGARKMLDREFGMDEAVSPDYFQVEKLGTIDRNQKVAFMVTDNFNIYVGASGHPTMLRGRQKQDMMGGGWLDLKSGRLWFISGSLGKFPRHYQSAVKGALENSFRTDFKVMR